MAPRRFIKKKYLILVFRFHRQFFFGSFVIQSNLILLSFKLKSDPQLVTPKIKCQKKVGDLLGCGRNGNRCAKYKLI